jgi:hypothetical protein
MVVVGIDEVVTDVVPLTIGFVTIEVVATEVVAIVDDDAGIVVVATVVDGLEQITQIGNTVVVTLVVVEELLDVEL